MTREALFSSSYRRGLPLFGYGLLWLMATLGLFGVLNGLLGSDGAAANFVTAVAASALAGGAGGAVTMLNRLGDHVAVKQDFVDQSLVYYILQPPVGAIAGVAVFTLITVPGTLIINFATLRQLPVVQILASSTFTAIYLLLAWTAGYYQQQGFLKLRAMLRQTQPESHLPAPINPNAPFSFKEWYRRQRQLRRWSYTWGIFVLGYGIFWAVALLFSFLQSGQAILQPEPAPVILPMMILLAAWPTALAGGLGGVFGMLNKLYQQVSYDQDFDRQALMWYLVQPVVGAMFGVVLYLLVAAGYLSLQRLFSARTSQIVDASTVIMLQMLLGWIAGFRQEIISELLLKLAGSVADFFRAVLKLLNPFTLFNKTKREAALAELAKQNQIFKSLTEDSSKSDGLKWWAAD